MKNKVVILVTVLALASMVSAVIVDGSLVTHLEADSLGLADGTPVGTWTDLATGGNATQPTAGLQPTYVAGSAAFNGHASVKFDGTDDWMDMVDAVTVDSFTLFLVGKLNATGADQYFISGQPGATDSRLRICEYGWSNNWRYRAGSSDYSTPAKDTSMHWFAMNSVSEGWLDSAPIGGGTNTATSTPALLMGAYWDAGGFARNFLNGEISEIVLYNRVLDTAEVDQINAELAAKYIPEPATLMLLGLGGLVLRRRK